MGGGWAGPPDELAMKDSELEGTVHTFLQMYSAAENDNDRAEIRENLTKTLVEQFAIRQQRREREIAEIEARVKRLRDALKKRADAKQKIIEQRLNELLSDAEGLGWGDAGASGFAPPGGGRFGFGGAGVFGQSGAAPGAAPPRE
jgi:hypothetical protein